MKHLFVIYLLCAYICIASVNSKKIHFANKNSKAIVKFEEGNKYGQNFLATGDSSNRLLFEVSEDETVNDMVIQIQQECNEKEHGTIFIGCHPKYYDNSDKVYTVTEVKEYQSQFEQEIMKTLEYAKEYISHFKKLPHLGTISFRISKNLDNAVIKSVLENISNNEKIWFVEVASFKLKSGFENSKKVLIEKSKSSTKAQESVTTTQNNTCPAYPYYPFYPAPIHPVTEAPVCYVETTSAPQDNQTVYTSEKYFMDQWHLWNDVYPESDTDATYMWYANAGKHKEVINIGMVDGGFIVNSLDVNGALWQNPNEIPNNGIDDDGNGYIDDINGWDFDANSPNFTYCNDSEGCHGTDCIKCMAAPVNGHGGVGMSQHVVVTPMEAGFTDTIWEAFEYMIAQNITISSNSWGFMSDVDLSLDPFLKGSFLELNSHGHLFIVAAGNEYTHTSNVYSYPQSYNLPNTLAVGSSTVDGYIACHSTYGSPHVHVFAPGECVVVAAEDPNYAWLLYGTSFACPITAGVAGEIKSLYPHLTAAEIKEAITNTCTINSAKISTEHCTCGGLLNGYNAVKYAEEHFTGAQNGYYTDVSDLWYSKLTQHLENLISQC